MTRRGVIAAVLGSAIAGHIVLGVVAGGAVLTAIRARAAPPAEPVFPAPARPVSPIVSPRWSTERARNDAGEARNVMAALAPLNGRTVADIGAGEGYYEPPLARAVGRKGYVIAEDIDAATVARLARRVRPLANVVARLGRPDDAALAPASVDVVLMVHMYHEIGEPYALLWRLRRSLRVGGRIAIVDADRPSGEHGTPPQLLACELGAIGYARTSSRPLGDGVYLAIFEPRALPDTIRVCR